MRFGVILFPWMRVSRPWQFDQSVLHDGRLNTYSFVFAGAKIILHAALPSVTSSTSSVFLTSHSDFCQELHDSPFVIFLLGLERFTSHSSPPTGELS